MQEILSVINDRRSVRKYDKDIPVTKTQLERLLLAAMLAPSARNERPWEFIAVTSRDVLDKIAEVHPHAKMCRTATAAIVVVGLPSPDPAYTGYFAQDCGAATQNILLEAVNMGLATCWLGVHPVPGRVAAIRELFSIPEPKIPFNVIAIGVPDEAPSQKGFYEAAKVQFVE